MKNRLGPTRSILLALALTVFGAGAEPRRARSRRPTSSSSRSFRWTEITSSSVIRMEHVR